MTNWNTQTVARESNADGCQSLILVLTGFSVGLTLLIEWIESNSEWIFMRFLEEVFIWDMKAFKYIHIIMLLWHHMPLWRFELWQISARLRFDSDFISLCLHILYIMIIFVTHRCHLQGLQCLTLLAGRHEWHLASRNLLWLFWKIVLEGPAHPRVTLERKAG